MFKFTLIAIILIASFVINSITFGNQGRKLRYEMYSELLEQGYDIKTSQADKKVKIAILKIRLTSLVLALLSIFIIKML